jgi:phasin family protein
MATNSNAATDAASKIDAAAEKAYAEAAANAEVAPKADAPKKAAKKVAKKPAEKTAKKVAAEKPAAKKAVAKKAKIKSPKKTTTKKSKKSAAAAKPAKKLKDTIMAKAKDTNITDTAKSMAADAQTRVKTAAAKAGEFAGEVNEFNKGNIEAVVESGKILFAGAQEMSRENIATGKTVLETVTGDVKKMAGVKSPTELVQLQGELARRNLDAAISFGSKSTESWLKIYNDAFAPISSRVSVAAERIKKAA